MKLVQDAQFREERARFGLRFSCEDCAQFEPARGRCAHGFPTVEHRASRYEAGSETPLVFCKEFEVA